MDHSCNKKVICIHYGSFIANFIYLLWSCFRIIQGSLLKKLGKEKTLVWQKHMFLVHFSSFLHLSIASLPFLSTFLFLPNHFSTLRTPFPVLCSLRPFCPLAIPPESNCRQTNCNLGWTGPRRRWGVCWEFTRGLGWEVVTD